MDKMKELMKRKDEIERAIKEQNATLESEQNIGMTGALIDPEGYPRADIDVYTVRHARHKLICLQNDHKAVMKEIEETLYEIHADAKTNLQSRSEDSMSKEEEMAPIVRIDRVDTGSPAYLAGLEVGDEILQFGSITEKNFQSLQNIASSVQHSEGKEIVLKILRNNHKMNVTLIPNTWSGRGLLGCNIVPIKR